mmetsp:Transcript_31900/g.73221  ORF Transcript_31900/g.73221 Transcript_31900/m.73221 type:complete len:206 (+) Transcript_31900:69-686(+)
MPAPGATPAKLLSALPRAATPAATPPPTAAAPAAAAPAARAPLLFSRAALALFSMTSRTLTLTISATLACSSGLNAALIFSIGTKARTLSYTPLTSMTTIMAWAMMLLIMVTKVMMRLVSIITTWVVAGVIMPLSKRMGMRIENRLCASRSTVFQFFTRSIIGCFHERSVMFTTYSARRRYNWELVPAAPMNTPIRIFLKSSNTK